MQRKCLLAVLFVTIGVASSIMGNAKEEKKTIVAPVSVESEEALLEILNRGSEKEICAFNGIGKTTASAIIAQRPYKTLEDLLKVKGVGKSTLKKFTATIKKNEAGKKGNAPTETTECNLLKLINEGDEKELCALKGVGKATAQTIINGRPYASLEELLKIKGISKKKLEKMEKSATQSCAMEKGGTEDTAKTTATEETTGYCVKCKAKRTMKDTQRVTMKNGRPALKGKCSACGTGMYRILPSKKK